MLQIAWLAVFGFAAESVDSPFRPGQLQTAGAVTPADVVAGYRSNASLFGHSRVTWRLMYRRTPAWYEDRKAESRRLERRLAQEKDGERKQRLSRQLDALLSADQGPAEEWYLQDYWTDGERVQVRTPASPKLQRAEAEK
jgi:hypothetical protein